MNERDKEFAIQSGLMRKYNYAYSTELHQWAELVRADERDACAALDFRKEIGLTSDQDYKVSQLILLRGNK